MTLRVGLGCMPMTDTKAREPRQGIRTIHAALDAGVTLLDTADAYAPSAEEFGANELLVARALREWSGRRDEVVVATKGGHTRHGDDWGLNGRPEYLRHACEQSLRRLETDRIDLYQYHRPDPDVPFAESVGALRDLVEQGKVRMVGLSNVTVEQLEEARAIVDVAAVQNQLSLSYTGPLSRGEVAACEAAGVAFLAWSPLGGIGRARDLEHAGSPVAEIAQERRVSPQRVALAWLLALSEAVVPIPGASRPESILDSLAATTLALEPGEVERISRYAAA